jgi:fatty acid synthase subunit beta, fungi type
MKSTVDCEVSLASNDLRWNFRVPLDERPLVLFHLSNFKAVSPRWLIASEDDPVARQFSIVALVSKFLEYLLDIGAKEQILRAVVQAFNRDFLPTANIHDIAMKLESPTRAQLLNTYYRASKVSGSHGQSAESALFKAAGTGTTSLCAIFGGQGFVNTNCLRDLRDLYTTYEVFLKDLIEVAACTIKDLASLPSTAGFYEESGFDLHKWLVDPTSAPNQEHIATAPISFPVIGLISLAHYCITCQAAKKSPGEMRDLLQGVTGHSQGIIAAAAVARSGSWETFLDSTRLAMEMLFWIGFESHHSTPGSDLSAAAITDSEEAGEGRPSSMLSVRGLDLFSLQRIIQEMNTHLDEESQIYLALVNSRDSMVVAGPPQSLRGLSLRLRSLKASDGLDQSRIPFLRRKAVINYQFLPISAAFHSPYLGDAATRVTRALEPRSLTGHDLGIALYHTRTGEDLRQSGPDDVTENLIRMVTSEMVDWPKTCMRFTVSHILDFGPGRIGNLVHELTEGTGLRVILASELSTPSYEIGSKAELFASVKTSAAPNWGELYKPKLIKELNGEMKLNTKMSRLFGVPPVMVAGMTPTTVPWDFVAAIMNAGYHVELAGGGYSSPQEFEKAIRKISASVPAHRGITCNLIYVNPKAIAWQVPLLRQLIRDGIQIDGLTIGAGVPSAEIARDYIETIGLKHISFKPGSYESILQVINIAQTNPNFPIGLQLTGGRAGGHHSFEDFHTLALKSYSQIRKCSNIVLVAGSGFGSAEDTLPYLTGDWSRSLGYPLMPFDGVLLGSRMMVAKEAHTSFQAKSLIVKTEGAGDSEWHRSYDGSVGGIVTVNSEMGQPIHKLATRGVLLWKHLEKTIFSIKDQSKRLLKLQRNRNEIITRLNNDFAKPWFGINSAGDSVDIEDMTYLEVLRRLLALMYVAHQQRWIHPSYRTLVLDFIFRIQERLKPTSHLRVDIFSDPSQIIAEVSRCYETAETELLYPEDASFFISLCSRRGQKPVNFIPRLDEKFETWFKKDSLWQAEDIDAVVNQDVQRVCILQGPVAAQHSRIVDEPAGVILDDISKSHIEALLQRCYSEKDEEVDDTSRPPARPISPPNLENVLIEEWHLQRKYWLAASGAIPDPDSLARHIVWGRADWAQACLIDNSIYQGQQRVENPIRSAFRPQNGDIITVNSRANGEIESITLTSTDGRHGTSSDILIMSSRDGKQVTTTLSAPTLAEAESVTVSFEFLFMSEGVDCRLREDTDGRNERIKAFYAALWIGNFPESLVTAGLHSEFSGGKITLSERMVADFMTVVSRSDPYQAMQERAKRFVPLDICIVAAWVALVKPLMIPAIDGDLLRLLHRSNSFEYCPGAKTLKIGDVVESSSRISAVTIQPTGKLVEVSANIRRQGQPVVKAVSSFLIQGQFSDYENTFRSTDEPEIEVKVDSEKLRALILSRDWLTMDDPATNPLGKTFLFKLHTRTTYSERLGLNSLQVSGRICLTVANGTRQSVGSVRFENGPCSGNPVMDFLNRHGSPLQQRRLLDHPGLHGASSWKVRIPERNGPYSRVSTDTNPIHVSPVFAGYTHLPGTVTHGMYTSAAVRRVVEKVVAEADCSRFRRFSASFEGMVMPGDVLRVEMQHIANIDGRKVLKVEAFNESTNDKVLEAEAEIEQAATVYLFCGQGSQEKGMGMTLYNSSPAARALWNKGDKYLLELYGQSIHSGQS